MLVNTIHTWGEEIEETGVEKGRTLGVEEASMTIAERMLKKDLSWNLIVEMTGVTQDRYRQWKKSKASVMRAA